MGKWKEELICWNLQGLSRDCHLCILWCFALETYLWCLELALLELEVMYSIINHVMYPSVQ
jgi:hypothetical protein